MSKNIENHDSVLLLQDCIAGCKMALESMDDIREHTDDKQLRELIDKYYDEHPGHRRILQIGQLRLAHDPQGQHVHQHQQGQYAKKADNCSLAHIRALFCTP